MSPSKKNPEKDVKSTEKKAAPEAIEKAPADPAEEIKTEAAKPVAPKKAAPKPKPVKPILDDIPLDVEEKAELEEEEQLDLAKALNPDDDVLETTFVPTDTSERFLLVVDEESQRRNETVTIISQILPNAVVEVADDPEEAMEMMLECEFDTFVVNFLMPGYSASPFVKAVANHPEHPLLIGFAADKISDALDPKKGLKIIPLKRLFDLDASAALEAEGDGDG